MGDGLQETTHEVEALRDVEQVPTVGEKVLSDQGMLFGHSQTFIVHGR